MRPIRCNKPQILNLADGDAVDSGLQRVGRTRLGPTPDGRLFRSFHAWSQSIGTWSRMGRVKTGVINRGVAPVDAKQPQDSL